MIDLEKEREAFEESHNVHPDGTFYFHPELKQYIAINNEMEHTVDSFNEHWDTWLSCAESKQDQINALEESRMAWRECAMKIESGEYELVKKAEAEQAKADTKRINFLADKSQSVANVMLPTEIVERNLSSLRDAIDQAMMVEESEDE